MKKGNVLVVEDQKYVRSLLVDALDFFGYSPFEAKTPKEALSLVEQKSVDLSIVDFNLPEMDGLRLAEELWRINPIIPVFLISGMEEIGAKIKEKSQYLKGSLRFIEKPIDLVILKHYLDGAMRCAS
ncbi:response regulator [Thermovenabulum gondwanense]|uniref:Stage 0 sporulation protein A homolog n=1 Tax=Thermovenabulum gondwanense TaxID=520767 RepID=A0A162MWU3_9FIRM|nr:response regulator [Thermovenabulum gondwanense]KYO68045.1 Nitrogen regulation protein NR(I) [Thermovenabulum gondwanense]